MVASTAVQNAPPARSTSVALKTRQQGAWSSGDYAVVGTTLQIVGEELCEALDIHAGQKVLDVAAGNGNATLAAARRWCDVVSTDYVPSLLERGRRAPQREVCRSSFGRRTPRRCRLPTAVSTRWSRPSASCSRRTRTRRRRNCPGMPDAAARSGWPTGRRKASSASCSGRSASTCRRRLAQVAGVVGHPGAHRRNVRAVGARRSTPCRAISCSVTGRRSTSWKSSRAITARCSRPSPRSTRPTSKG